MYYCNSRYYNPDWGRFINADDLAGKVGQLLSHNLFAYCGNNPVNMVDSSGKESIALPSLGDLAWGGVNFASKALGLVGGVFISILVDATPTSAEDWDSYYEASKGRLTDRPGKIANKLGRTVDEIKKAIEQVKQGTGWRTGTRNNNPDVVVDTETGEVYPKATDGGIGDSIGNVNDYLEDEDW